MSSELRDLIYFDFAKAASLFSQAEGGLLEKLQETYESGNITKGSVGLNVPIIKADLGGDASQKTSVLESRVLHHDLLTRLEGWLKQNNLLVDLNVLQGETDFSDDSLRSFVNGPSFIVAEGWTEFWTYDRFRSMAAKYNDLVQFFETARVDGIKKSPIHKQVEAQIAQLREQLGQEKNQTTKSTIRQEIREREAALEEAVNPPTNQNKVQDWLLDAIK